MQNKVDINVPSTGRIDSLQGVRAIAFLGVFFYHAIRTFPGEGVIYSFFSTGIGPWGVSVFFVLSGFLMTYSYWSRPPKRSLKSMALFAIYKVKKLYPLHIVMLIFGTIYLLMGHHHDTFEIMKYLLITVPLMQTWSSLGYQAINSVAWYLSDSLFIYFMFPCVLFIIKNGIASKNILIVAKKIYILQVVIGYCVARYTTIDFIWVVYCHPLYRIGDFAIGGLIASFFITNSSKKNTLVYGSFREILALFVNVAVCASYSKVFVSASWFAPTCLFTPASVMLIYIFSQNAGIISRALNNNVIFWLADISPYGFLIHRIVANYFYALTVHFFHWEHTNYILAVAVPFVITVIATYLYVAAEKTVNRYVIIKKNVT